MFEHELSPKTSHFRSSQYGLHCLGTAARRAYSHRGGHALELLEGSVHPYGLLGGTRGDLHGSSSPSADEPEQRGRPSEQVPPPTRAALQFCPVSRAAPVKGRGALSTLYHGQHSRVKRDLAVGAAEIHPLDAATCELHRGSLGRHDLFAAHTPHTPMPRFTAASRQKAPENPGELGAALS